jgi:hypothetical protein
MSKELHMTANVGTIDRIARILVGLGLVAWGLGYVPSVPAPEWGLVAAVVGGIFAITGALGVCPLYRILGLSSCPR